MRLSYFLFLLSVSKTLHCKSLDSVMEPWFERQVCVMFFEDRFMESIHYKSCQSHPSFDVAYTRYIVYQCHCQNKCHYVQSLSHFLCWKPVGMVHYSLWPAWSLTSLCWSLFPFSGFLLLKDLYVPVSCPCILPQGLCHLQIPRQTLGLVSPHVRC